MKSNNIARALMSMSNLICVLLTMALCLLTRTAIAQDTPPFPTDNLQLWLRADSVEVTNGKVSRWYDLSPNNYIIQQTNTTAKPIINDSAINGFPALQFNGSSTYLTGGDILDLGNSNWTWLIVGKDRQRSWNRPYLAKTLYGSAIGRYSLSSSYFVFVPGPSNTEYNTGYYSADLNPANRWHILTWENNRNILKNTFYLNNNLVANASFSNNNMDNTSCFLIGAYNGTSGTTPMSGYYFNGEIAEIIVFDNVDSTLKNQVHDYLFSKYTPTQVSLGPDIHIPYGFCDTTITTAYNPDFISYLWNTGETNSVIHINSSGHYSVTVTNIFGGTSSDDINVYFPEVFQIHDTTICVGDTIYWNTGLSSEDYTFQWFMDSTPLPLQSKSPLNDNPSQSSLQALLPLKDNQPQSPLQALQPLKALPSSSSLPIHSPGSYYCIITDSLGCSFHTDTIHISIDNYPETTTFQYGDHNNSGAAVHYGSIEP